MMGKSLTSKKTKSNKKSKKPLKSVDKNTLVKIRDLEIRRGKDIVLRVPALDIIRGEVLAVVGPNGAGKSTLLLALARLLKPERGKIIFNDRHSKGDKQAQVESDTVYRRRIALVMQDPLLFDRSVFENVASGLRFRGMEKNDIQQKVPLWLDRLGVAHLSERRGGKLSGGEAQRVSLARALILEPELLLLDESFSALDPPTRAQLLDDLGKLLIEIATTTVFVTHDLPEAAQLATRLAVIMKNHLRQVGEPDLIFANPADEDVAIFLENKKCYSRPH